MERQFEWGRDIFTGFSSGVQRVRDRWHDGIGLAQQQWIQGQMSSQMSCEGIATETVSCLSGVKSPGKGGVRQVRKEPPLKSMDEFDNVAAGNEAARDQPAARSPQPAARSPQPAARSRHHF